MKSKLHSRVLEVNAGNEEKRVIREIRLEYYFENYVMFLVMTVAKEST